MLLGVGYAASLPTERHITPTPVLMITLSVMVFLVGLVSEQICPAFEAEMKAKGTRQRHKCGTTSAANHF